MADLNFSIFLDFFLFCIEVVNVLSKRVSLSIHSDALLKHLDCMFLLKFLHFKLLIKFFKLFKLLLLFFIIKAFLSFKKTDLSVSSNFFDPRQVHGVILSIWNFLFLYEIAWSAGQFFLFFLLIDWMWFLFDSLFFMQDSDFFLILPYKIIDIS